MNCPQCGATLEDDSKFCMLCGTSVQNGNVAHKTENIETIQSACIESDNSKQNEGGTPKNTLGLIAGTLLIAIGLVRILTADTDISSASFGGDFYTYTYQGIVRIAEILTSIEISLSWIIVSIGAAIDVYSMKK